MTRVVATIQGAYFLLTGVWPLLHMGSFLAITGPKADLWLVRTVGVLIGVIGFALLRAAAQGVGPGIRELAAGSAVGLAAIDVTYVALGRLWPVCLADAVAEGLLVAAWVVASWRDRR